MVIGNSEEKNLIHNVIDFIIDKQNISDCLAPEIPSEILKQIEIFPQEGETMAQLSFELCNNIVPYCSNFHSSAFVGFPDAGNSMAGLLGSIVSDLLQQNLINATFCSPMGTRVEMVVIKWLRQLVGYEVFNNNSVETVGGIVTTGGTLSNTVAMLLARIHKSHESYINGITNPDEFAVVVPQGIDHYSITSALHWTGCGKQIIEVPTQNYRYDLNALKKTLEQYKKRIMCVVAYAGDSRTMTIEDLQGVYNIVKNTDEDIWLHVDACNGFCLCFSEVLRNKLKGIHLWDSISMDPHKMMMLPYTASVLLVKKPADMIAIRTKSDLIMNDGMSLGEITPFLGSKPWMSLKIWCVMKQYGINGLGQIMERRYSLAQYLRKKLLSRSDFKVINPVDGFSVVFMYCPKNINLSIDKINQLNLLIYEKMLKEKKFYLHQFSLIDQYSEMADGAVVHPLRFFSGNETLTEERIDEIIEYVAQKGREICEKGIY